MWRAVLSLFLVAVVAQADFVAVQQAVLDKIAEQIRKDGTYQSCAAPQLASCGMSVCSGSGCGKCFEIRFTSDKQITGLFALCVWWYFILLFETSIPTD